MANTNLLLSSWIILLSVWIARHIFCISVIKQKKFWLLFFNYWHDVTKHHSAGVVFTQEPIIRFFCPTGTTHCTDQGKFGRNFANQDELWHQTEMKNEIKAYVVRKNKYKKELVL